MESKTVYLALYIPMTIKPIWQNLLVTPIKQQIETASWLIISTKEQEKVSKGKVIWIGKDVDEEISVWDTVYFPIYAPDELEVGDEKYLIVNQKSILGVEK